MGLVLVVEDDRMNRFTIEEMLAELGADYLMATNGAEAVDIAFDQGEQIDVVLMDIHMPQMTGDEAVRQIREADSHPPRDLAIVAMTADNNWHDEQRLRAVGFSGALPKPISFAGLRRAIQ